MHAELGLRRGLRHARLTTLLWLAAGCADQTFVLAASTDGGRDDRPDFSAFATIAPLATLSTGDSKDDDPSPTADLRLLFFNSQRPEGQGKEDIWLSSRAASSDAWSAPRPVVELNSEHRETGIALSADGLRVWFSSDRAGGAGGLDVYSAERADRTLPFALPTRVAELSSEGDDLISDVDELALTAWLSRRADDKSDYDLYVSQRASAQQPWPDARPLSELNSKAEESDAYALGDGAQLLFTRAEDLQIAGRASAHDPYTDVKPLAALNSSSDDRDPWVSPDARVVLFASNRSGSYQLYEALR